MTNDKQQKDRNRESPKNKKNEDEAFSFPFFFYEKCTGVELKQNRMRFDPPAAASIW